MNSTEGVEIEINMAAEVGLRIIKSLQFEFDTTYVVNRLDLDCLMQWVPREFETEHLFCLDCQLSSVINHFVQLYGLMLSRI